MSKNITDYVYVGWELRKAWTRIYLYNFWFLCLDKFVHISLTQNMYLNPELFNS